MKFSLYCIIGLIFFAGCGKKNPASTISVTWDGNINPYAPSPVSKSTINKRVFAHILPWFETPATNNGLWGQHWTGTNPSGQPLDNPNTTTNGQPNIASHYNPLIGPYASGDTTVIDYQLLLMKLSGIDGVFIDWPGRLNYSDFAGNAANTNAIISRIGKVGLKYAIVYEDHNLQYTNSPAVQVQIDMGYLQTNYFSDANYESISGIPLLLDFGPQTLTTASGWTSAFSNLSPKPAFFTLQYQSGEAGTNAIGEFNWVESDTITGSRNFYNYSYSGNKIGAAYPGYNSIYALEQANAGPTWVVTPSVKIFQQSLVLALQQPGQYMQLVTWNDYGEGTIIEPTTQFQYSYLTTLQQQLGVQSTLSVSDLQAVSNLFTARKNNIGANYNQTNLNELDQIYYYMTSLRMDSAKALLQKDF
jgi:hypothetical protein